MSEFIELFSLHGHWIKCSEIFETVREKPVDVERLGLSKDVNELLVVFMTLNRLAVAYGLLYVVIEGYKELNLEDKEIDTLLANTDYVLKLRRLRNSMFHYQKHPLPKKFWDFIFIPDSEQWIKKLKSAFERYFTSTLGIQEFLENLKKSMSK